MTVTTKRSTSQLRAIGQLVRPCTTSYRTTRNERKYEASLQLHSLTVKTKELVRGTTKTRGQLKRTYERRRGEMRAVQTSTRALQSWLQQSGAAVMQQKRRRAWDRKL